MKKKILIILSLAMALTSCKGLKEEIDEPIKKVEIEANKRVENNKDKEISKKEEEKNTEKDKKEEEEKLSENKKEIESNPLFAELEGKVFLSYLSNGSEHIIFYEDGRFDGSWWSGDGVSMLANLYTGQFSDPKKLDDKTYSIKLKKLEYQSPTSGTDTRDGLSIRYVESQYFDKKMIGDEYTVHLPGTSLADLDNKGIKYYFDYNPDVENGLVNMYTMSKDSSEAFELGRAIYMTELKTASKLASKPGQNYFASDIYGENHKTQTNNQAQSNKGPKKTVGINKTPEALGFLDHATQIDMGDVFISNYNKSKEKALGQVIESEDSLDFISNRPESFYNLDYSKKYLDRLEDKTLSDVDFENDDDQPIIKVLGEIIYEIKLEPSYDTDNQYVNIYEYTLLARKRDGELILISLDYMGDIDTATFIAEDGSDLVKAWALPIATYTIDHKDYGKIKVYKFAGGEGMQEAAFEKYGETYGF